MTKKYGTYVINAVLVQLFSLLLSTVFFLILLFFFKYGVWAQPNSVLQTTEALNVGTKVITFYEEYFNISFPLPKQGKMMDVIFHDQSGIL